MYMNKNNKCVAAPILFKALAKKLFLLH